MQITKFEISSDKSKIDLTITDAADLVSLSLWDHKTYKDYSKLIDLSDKLTGSATENIEISPVDLGIAYFDGIYFIEAEDPTETFIDFTSELSRYKECAVVKKLEAITSSCNSCNDTKNIEFQNVNSTIEILEYALDLRYINEILLLVETLDKYCTNKCNSCGKGTSDISSYENSNPDTIEIIVFGGDATSNFD